MKRAPVWKHWNGANCVDNSAAAKAAPPLIMLPESVANTTNTSFTQMISFLSENASFLNECLLQIQHVSQCHQLENECSYPLCISLKRDMYVCPSPLP